MEKDEGFRFQKLDVYKVAREIAAHQWAPSIERGFAAFSDLVRVHEARIADAELRDQATRAAKSAFLGLCEGLPNEAPGLRRRYFTQSRNSVCELALALRLKRMLRALTDRGR
jgi:hypothetical protein